MPKRQTVEYISPRDYAQRIGFHFNTVYRWIRTGVLPFMKREKGNRTFYLIETGTPPPMLKPGPRPVSDLPVDNDAGF